MNNKESISAIIDSSIEGIGSIRGQLDTIIGMSDLAIGTLRDGGRIFIVGNGGSAADAQHTAAELVGQLGLGMKRHPLTAIALTTDTSIITALANDFGFQEVFSHQLKAQGKSGDLLIAISTSGKSENILRAARVAREIGIDVIALTGPGQSPLSQLAEFTLTVDAPNTPRIQEAHRVVLHILCELIESAFAGSNA